MPTQRPSAPPASFPLQNMADLAMKTAFRLIQSPSFQLTTITPHTVPGTRGFPRPGVWLFPISGTQEVKHSLQLGSEGITPYSASRRPVLPGNRLPFCHAVAMTLQQQL